MTTRRLEIMLPWADDPIHYSKGIHSPRNFIEALGEHLVRVEQWPEGVEQLRPELVGYGLMRYGPPLDNTYDYSVWRADKPGPGVFPISVYCDANGAHYANMDRAKCLAFHFGKGAE